MLDAMMYEEKQNMHPMCSAALPVFRTGRTLVRENSKQ